MVSQTFKKSTYPHLLLQHLDDSLADPQRNCRVLHIQDTAALILTLMVPGPAPKGPRATVIQQCS